MAVGPPLGEKRRGRRGRRGKVYDIYTHIHKVNTRTSFLTVGVKARENLGKGNYII